MAKRPPQRPTPARPGFQKPSTLATLTQQQATWTASYSVLMRGQVSIVL